MSAKEILDKLKDCVNNPIDIEVDQFTQEAYHIPNYFCLDATTNDCKLLLDYITNLQEEIERLGNELQVQIEDNVRLNEYIEEQDKKSQQKENIIKEVREYIEDLYDVRFTDKDKRKILEILDKENI